MPTTLSSGVSLTQVYYLMFVKYYNFILFAFLFDVICLGQVQLAGGNFALALAMTVISNLLGILVVSFLNLFYHHVVSHSLVSTCICL